MTSGVIRVVSQSDAQVKFENSFPARSCPRSIVVPEEGGSILCSPEDQSNRAARVRVRVLGEDYGVASQSLH